MRNFITGHPALYTPLLLCWRFVLSVWYTVRLVLNHKIKVYASSCTYYFLVSLVPVVILVGWGAAVLVDRLALVDNLDMLENIQLYSQMQSMTSTLGLNMSSSSLKAVGIIGIIYGLWYASSLMKSIHNAFAVIFPAKTKRKGIITMILAHIMVPLLMIIAIIASSLSTAITQAFRWLLADTLHLVSQALLASLLTPLVTLFMIAVSAYACFMLLTPGRPKSKPAMIGAVLFALYFMILQQGLSIVMVKLIASYARYGALGSLLLLLLWAFLIFQGMFMVAEYVRVIDNFREINYAQYVYAHLKDKPSFLEKIVMLILPFGDNSYLAEFKKDEKKSYDGTALAFCKVKRGEVVISHYGQELRTLRDGEMYNQIGAHSPVVELTALSYSKVLIVSEKGMNELMLWHSEAWACISASEATYLAYIDNK